MTNPILVVGQQIPFDQIRAEHVDPAINLLIEEARNNLNQIAQEPGPRSYENTLFALDMATERLDVAMSVVEHLESVCSTAELREAHNRVRPEVSAFYASIPLHAGLWRALKELAVSETAKTLSGARRRFMEKTLEDFRRHGADLEPTGKQRLEGISRELAELNNQFSQNLLDSTAAWALVITDPTQLSGLPKSALDAAKESAVAKKQDGYRFSLQAPSVLPLLTYLDDSSIREKVWRAYNARAGSGAFDNTKVIARIIELRREKAALLGYASFAELVLEDRMAKSSATARKFLADLEAKSRGAFERENGELLAFRRSLDPTAPALQPWDVAYFAEKQRQARYNFDEEELRPYFPLPAVLLGLFETARQLYGVTIEPDPSLPTWQHSVRGFAITDADGTRAGSFYVDAHPRDEKRAGAWMHGLITGTLQEGKMTPHLALICANLTPPVKEAPALLTHSEVETLFHEFGHLLHHLLSRVEVRSLGGTNVAWDFVELPSQIMENWCWEKSALDLFARHHQTKETIPVEMFEKMRRARTYRAANAMMRQIGFAVVDFALHLDFDGKDKEGVAAYARRLMEAYSPAPLPEDYSFITTFGHLFSSDTGYAAGYYSYKWAEVLDADAFTRFKRQGIFSREEGERFRRLLLERGNTEDPLLLYRAFMGRDPDPEALLVRSGLGV